MAFKNLFFKETKEESKKSPEVKKETIVTPATKPISLGGTVPPQNFSSTTVAISPDQHKEYVDYINSIFEKENLPGPDYQEFITSVNGLSQEAIDLSTKFKTVFAALKTMGCDKKRLLESANKYIEILSNLTGEFAKSVDQTIKEEVGNKQNSLNKLIDENKEIENSMLRLTEQKNKNHEKIQAMTAEINNELAALNGNKKTFEDVSNQFIMNIQNDIENINKYIV